MTSHAYTEDQLVEQPAIGLFSELGWTTVSAMEEILGPDGTLGRETKGEVVLTPRLRAALGKLNPTLPETAITNAMGRGSARALRHFGRGASPCIASFCFSKVWEILI